MNQNFLDLEVHIFTHSRSEPKSEARMEAGGATEAQSVRGRGWVKFDEDNADDSTQQQQMSNDESPGSIEVYRY